MNTVFSCIGRKYAEHVVEAWKEVSHIDADPMPLTLICHSASVASGWWDVGRNLGELIALIHSELSEGLEGARKDLPSDHLPGVTMLEEELADVLIRVYDLAGALDFNIRKTLQKKLKYNLSREDHKPENRAKPGGKQF